MTDHQFSIIVDLLNKIERNTSSIDTNMPVSNNSKDIEKACELLYKILQELKEQ